MNKGVWYQPGIKAGFNKEQVEVVVSINQQHAGFAVAWIKRFIVRQQFITPLVRSFTHKDMCEFNMRDVVIPGRAFPSQETNDRRSICSECQ